MTQQIAHSAHLVATEANPLEVVLILRERRILNFFFCFFITSLILSDCSDEFRRIILMNLLFLMVNSERLSKWLSKSFLTLKWV